MLYSRTLSNHKHIVITLFFYPDCVKNQNPVIYANVTPILTRGGQADSTPQKKKKKKKKKKNGAPFCNKL